MLLEGDAYKRGSQIRKVGKAIVEVYQALRGTRDGRYSCLPVGVTTKLIRCSFGIPCLHTPKYTSVLTHIVD